MVKKLRPVQRVTRSRMLSFATEEGEMVKRVFAAAAIAVVCPAILAEAHVTRIEMAKTERVESPPAAAQGAAQVPPYERISGKFYGELDPADAKNAIITDLKLAPRNARGKVEYIGTF